MNTSLYRHFANNGALLYVGISLSWPARTKAHAQKSNWFEQVAKVEIEQFSSREAALEAEREAIKRERPKFNIVHNRQAQVSPPQREFKKKAVELTAESMRFMGARERRRAVDQYACQTSDQRRDNPLLELITGPDALVGPPLVYRDNQISLLIAHGVFGTPGFIDEIVLGDFYRPELPAWSDRCVSVLTLRRGTDLTIDEAKAKRREIVAELQTLLRSVETYDTDIALAVANAARFPSAKAQRILDDFALERGNAT